MNRFTSTPGGDCPQNNNAANDDDDKVINLDAETDVYFNGLPPGYCFCPKDYELIIDYLKRKLDNELLPRNKMHDVNIYKYNPEKLSKKYPLTSNKEWYFFTPRDRKYCNGTRPNRAAGNGYWKATGADIQILHKDQLIGFKKSLVFYEGKPPEGEKTSWLMTEFRVNAEPRKRTSTNDMKLDDYILCKIYKTDSEKENKKKRKSRDYDESQTINYPSFDYSQDQQIHICCSLPQNYATPTTTIAAPLNSMPMNSVDDVAAVVVPDCNACASNMPVNSETTNADAETSDFEFEMNLLIYSPPDMQL